MTHDDFHTAYAAALRSYLETRNQEDLAVGHELGRRALHDDISMLEIVEKHSELYHRLVVELPGFDGGGGAGLPAADAGPARCRDARIPGRHKALRGAAGPRRGSRRSRRVPQRGGEFPAGGILRRRSHRGRHRSQRRFHQTDRLPGRTASPTNGRFRGWSTKRQRAYNNPG